MRCRSRIGRASAVRRRCSTAGGTERRGAPQHRSAPTGARGCGVVTFGTSALPSPPRDPFRVSIPLSQSAGNDVVRGACNPSVTALPDCARATQVTPSRPASRGHPRHRRTAQSIDRRATTTSRRPGPSADDGRAARAAPRAGAPALLDRVGWIGSPEASTATGTRPRSWPRSSDSRCRHRHHRITEPPQDLVGLAASDRGEARCGAGAGRRHVDQPAAQAPGLSPRWNESPGDGTPEVIGGFAPRRSPRWLNSDQRRCSTLFEMRCG